MKIRVWLIGLNVATAVVLVALVYPLAGDDAPQSTRDPQQARNGLPVYDAENQLLLPDDYREWVFIGSSLGLTYSDDPPRTEKFSHVYINPFGFREAASPATASTPRPTTCSRSFIRCCGQLIEVAIIGR